MQTETETGSGLRFVRFQDLNSPGYRSGTNLGSQESGLTPIFLSLIDILFFDSVSGKTLAKMRQEGE